MAAEISKSYRTLRERQPMGLGEYPDKIGGYHGCLPWYSSSSLKLQGNWIQLPVLRAGIKRSSGARSDRTLKLMEGEDEL
jgi:hypothetical protein